MTRSIDTAASAGRLTESDCRISDFARLLDQETLLADYQYASDTNRGVLFYSAEVIRAQAAEPEPREQIADELARALLSGPGIVVFTGAFDTEHALDQTTALFSGIVAEQHASGIVNGDHFAKPGANDRIWNALQKLAITAPELFVRYYPTTSWPWCRRPGWDPCTR